MVKLQPKTSPVFGFTSKHKRIVNVLKSDISITEAYDPQSDLPEPTSKPYVGIWDTGASGTVINAKIVKELKLKPSGKIVCKAVGSGGKINEYKTNTYSVNIILPNKVTIMGVVAAEGEIGEGDALIGMDIIHSGDFAVTNFGSKTTLSFRIPSVKEIDFVKEINDIKSKAMPKVGRNNPCPCGSGKKYKFCHGR